MGDHNFDLGYSDGKTDATQSKGKQTLKRLLGRLFQVDQLLPGAEARLDEYWRGYGTGFEDEIRFNSIAAAVQQNEGVMIMSANDDVQSWANQMGWCVGTRDYLLDLKADSINVSVKFRELINWASTHKYMKEYLDRYSPILGDMEGEIESLSKFIDRELISYVDEQAVVVSDVLKKLT